MKIVIYGCGDFAKKMLPFIQKKNISILYFILTEKNIDNFCGYTVKSVQEVDFKDIDYLVISSNIYFDEMFFELSKLPSYDKMFENKIKSFSGFLNLFIDNDSCYRSVTVSGGLNYFFSKEDEVLGPMMMYNNVNHGAEIMKNMFLLSEMNPRFKKNGFFLDIGANIGTASIYAKYLNPEFKVIAFEPGEKNFNLLRCNCIINRMEDIRLEHYALGKEEGILSYIYKSNHPGSSYVSRASEVEGGEKCRITSLDSFLNLNSISPLDVSFVWMDTEGFEDEVVIGGSKTLWCKQIENGVPFIQEFNPRSYFQKGNMDWYCKILKESYSYFIDARQVDVNSVQKIPIERLSQFANETKKQTDLFFF